jgi:beta-galactosidase
VPEKETTVIIDYKNAGIGSASCGPELNPIYQITEKEFDFSFCFKPCFVGNLSLFDEYVK